MLHALWPLEYVRGQLTRYITIITEGQTVVGLHIWFIVQYLHPLITTNHILNFWYLCQLFVQIKAAVNFSELTYHVFAPNRSRKKKTFSHQNFINKSMFSHQILYRFRTKMMTFSPLLVTFSHQILYCFRTNILLINQRYWSSLI